jgi:O-antigen/teichoic acid export membrane protein
MAFIEAAGKMAAIAMMRLVQIALSACACWLAMIGGEGLWAAVLVSLGGVVVPVIWLFIRWPLLLKQLIPHLGRNVTVRTELFQVQWRIAISWICTYFSSQVYALILMQLHGPAISGRLALSMAIVNMVGVLALSSMAGRVAFVGHDAARNNIIDIKKKFNKDLLFFGLINAVGIVGIAFGFWIIDATPYIDRVLPFWQMGVLFLFTLVINLINLFSTYIRSYLREPFMRVNLLTTIITLPLAYWAALHYSAVGVVFSLASVAVFITLPFSLYVWRLEIMQYSRNAELKGVRG